MIVCPTPPQMNDFCDLLGTPDAPVSKIVSVKVKFQARFFSEVSPSSYFGQTEGLAGNLKTTGGPRIVRFLGLGKSSTMRN